MLVAVSLDHILRGRQSSRTACPLALAVKELFPDSTVLVGAWTVFIDGFAYSMGDDAQRFVSDFDLDKIAEPAVFDLIPTAPKTT